MTTEQKLANAVTLLKMILSEGQRVDPATLAAIREFVTETAQSK